MYIYDTEHEIEHRLLESDELDNTIIEKIKRILDSDNPFVMRFRQLAQRQDLPQCKLLIKERPSSERQYVLPTASQVAAIISADESLPADTTRDIIVQTHGGFPISLKEFSGYYDPLQYPLFLPYGTYGWDSDTCTINNVRVTCCDYYAYMLQVLFFLSNLTLYLRCFKLVLPDISL